MKQFIILNEPNSNSTHSKQISTENQTKSLPMGLILLPFTEQKSNNYQIHSTNFHPTPLLNYPQRPHYYLPNTVGAQIGYCLSPLPQNTNTIKHLNFQSFISNTNYTSSTLSSSSSSSFSSSNLLLSSQPTAISSSSIQPISLSPSKSIQQNNQLNQMNLVQLEIKNNENLTKKVLPTPPCLSKRIRQTFLNKLNTQPVESCAQLPRRKKKLV